MDNISNRYFARIVMSLMLIAGFVSQVHAVGTPAGTQVDNQATLNYSVGGTAQIPVTSDDPNQGGANDATSFIVDTKVDVTVTWQDGANVQVAPGQDGATPLPNPPSVLEFLVTNEGNADFQDFALSSANVGGDDFDPSAVQIYVDDGDGVYNSALDTATFIDELSSDSTGGANEITVFVVGSIPSSQTNGQTSNIALIATAHEASGSTGSLGALTVADTLDNDIAFGAGANQIVFADAAGTAATDLVTDGEHSATGTYVIAATSVAVRKSSTVTDDGLGNTSATAKAIPGATVTYSIEIENSGATGATAITLTDPIDVSNLSYNNPSVSFDAGCGGATSESFSSPNLTVNVGSIAAGTTCTVTFDVTIL
tara:strand:+ start:31171 stop:32280 length:1110 start_codon:yes stop_codon:yes gene_type:complete